MTLIYKLGLIGLSTVGAGASVPLFLRNGSFAHPNSNNKYVWQFSSSPSPLFNSTDTDLGIKILLELDSEHEKTVNECKSCDKFIRRFKLKVVEKDGREGNFDRMIVFPDGAVRIVGKNYKLGQGEKKNDVELAQKLKKIESLNVGNHIMVDLKDIGLETSSCKWSESSIECELDILGWKLLKLDDNNKPKITFYAQH